MAALILPSRRVVQPQGGEQIAQKWAQKSPVLLASAASGFVNIVNGVSPAIGSTANFRASSVGIGAVGTSSSTTSTVGFDDYAFGGTTPITVIAFSDEQPGASRSFLAQATEVILRMSTAGTGVEFILNSFSTNDRATAVADSRSTPGFFAAGTYGPSGKLRAYANTAMAEVTPTGSYANSAELFTAIYTQGLNQLFDKRLALLAIFRSEFSPAELRELSENPWQLFKPVERRIWVPVSAGGLSQLQKTYEVIFNVRENIFNDFNILFDTRGFLSGDLNFNNNLRGYLNNSKEVNFNILSAIEKNSDMGYNLLGAFSNSLLVDYDIRGSSETNSLIDYKVRTSLLDTSDFDYKIRSAIVFENDVEYALRTFIPSDLVTTYNILSSGQVVSPLSISYNIRTAVDNSNNLSWYVRSIETTSTEIIYNIRGKTELSSEEITYKIRTSNASTGELNYKIKGFESGSSSFEYNILGLSQVKKDLPLLYSVLSSILPNWTDVYLKSNGSVDVYLKSNGDGVFTVVIK